MAEYIDRETLFEEIRKEFRPYWQIPCDYEDKVTQKMVTKMRGLIDKLTAADVVEVVHGEWVYCPETITLRSHFYCSACKVVRFEHYTKNNFKYCPNCGAKMDGKRKDGDEE